MYRCPDEVLIHNILTFFGPDELLALSSVDKRLNELTRDRELWQAIPATQKSTNWIEKEDIPVIHWLHDQLSPRDQYVFSRKLMKEIVQKHLYIKRRAFSPFMTGGVGILLSQIPLQVSTSFSNPLASATVEATTASLILYPWASQIKDTSRSVLVVSSNIAIAFVLNIIRYQKEYSSLVRPGVEAILGTFGSALVSSHLMIDNRMPLLSIAPILSTTAILPHVLFHSGPLEGAVTFLSTAFCTRLFCFSFKFSNRNARFLRGCTLLAMGGVALYQNSPMSFISSLFGAYHVSKYFHKSIRMESDLVTTLFFLGNLDYFRGLSNLSSYVTSLFLDIEIMKSKRLSFVKRWTEAPLRLLTYASETPPAIRIRTNIVKRIKEIYRAFFSF